MYRTSSKQGGSQTQASFPIAQTGPVHRHPIAGARGPTGIENDSTQALFNYERERKRPLSDDDSDSSDYEGMGGLLDDPETSASEGEDSDDSDNSDLEAPAANAPVNPGAPRALRKQARSGNSQAAKSLKRASAGNAQVPRKVHRTGTHLANRARHGEHHSSQRLNVPGRRAGSVLPSGGTCGLLHCQEIIVPLTQECEPALRTREEMKRYKGKFNGPYNLARLRLCLLDHAFNPNGSFLVHSHCLQAQFGVSHGYISNLHRSKIKLVGASTKTVTKEYVLKHGFQGDLLVPDGDAAVHTQLQYLERCAYDSEVKVVNTDRGRHGLTKKKSNHAKTKTMDAFVDFVMKNRVGTGRTRDKHGRYHGSEFYLDCKFKQLKKQTGQGRKNKPDDQILSEAFLQALSPNILKCNSGTIQVWFNELFSVGSPHGHTVLHPHKSAVCPLCCQFQMDLEACGLSLQACQGKADCGERTKSIDETKQAIIEIEAEQREHGLETHEAQEAYRSCINSAHADYIVIVDAWIVVWEAVAKMVAATCASTSVDELLQQICGDVVFQEFCELASVFRFVISSDYQQDKPWPAWHSSPQPGPTYFLSKITSYIMIICAESCGETSGDSRMGRNIVYVRREAVGGAKDSNDTVSTILDYLSSPTSITCEQPTMYRTGYDQNGPVDAATSTNPTGPTQAARPEGDNWAGALPGGHSVLVEMPISSTTFVPGSVESTAFVGAQILYNQPLIGWQIGEVIEPSRDRRRKDPVNGKVPNFVVQYQSTDADPNTSMAQCLDPTHYAQSSQSPVGSWVLVVRDIGPCANCTENFLHIEPSDFHVPAGYELELEAPPDRILEFGNSSGEGLIGRKFIQRWPDYGWCVGTIVAQNKKKRAEQGTRINFIAKYDGFDGDAEEGLYAGLGTGPLVCLGLHRCSGTARRSLAPSHSLGLSGGGHGSVQ